MLRSCAARFLQRPLAKLISTLRAPKSSEGYKAIGGGSPLRRITEEQAEALAQSLKGRGLDAKVYVGMRYWTPFIDDAMEQVRPAFVSSVKHMQHYPGSLLGIISIVALVVPLQPLPHRCRKPPSANCSLCKFVQREWCTVCAPLSVLR